MTYNDNMALYLWKRKGCLCEADIDITISDSGPFAVTSANLDCNCVRQATQSMNTKQLIILFKVI